MAKPQVSIVIPYFNGNAYIGELLKSIAIQTFTDLEIIVINDGSTRQQTDLLLGTIDRFPNIQTRLIHNQTNSGPAASRNIGVTSSEGQYISFIDQDDILCGRYSLEYRVRLLQTSPQFDGVGGYSQHIGTDGLVLLPPSPPRPEFLEAVTQPEHVLKVCCDYALKYSENFIAVPFLVAGSSLFRKSAILDTSFLPAFDTEEDFEWLLRFLPNHLFKVEMIPFHFRREHAAQFHLSHNSKLIAQLMAKARQIRMSL